jgi:hypothetical protein
LKAQFISVFSALLRTATSQVCAIEQTCNMGPRYVTEMTVIVSVKRGRNSGRAGPRHTNTNYCTDVIPEVSRPDDKYQK